MENKGKTPNIPPVEPLKATKPCQIRKMFTISNAVIAEACFNKHHKKS